MISEAVLMRSAAFFLIGYTLTACAISAAAPIAPSSSHRYRLQFRILHPWHQASLSTLHTFSPILKAARMLNCSANSRSATCPQAWVQKSNSRSNDTNARQLSKYSIPEFGAGQRHLSDRGHSDDRFRPSTEEMVLPRGNCTFFTHKPFPRYRNHRRTRESSAVCFLQKICPAG